MCTDATLEDWTFVPSNQRWIEQNAVLKSGIASWISLGFSRSRLPVLETKLGHRGQNGRMALTAGLGVMGKDEIGVHLMRLDLSTYVASRNVRVDFWS